MTTTKDIRAQLADLKTSFTSAGIEITSKLDKTLMKAGALVERDAKLYLTEDQHVDTGRLRGSITHRLVDGLQYRSVEIGTNVDYAHDVELGSGPHTVPLADLEAWVRRKGLAGGGFAKNKIGRGYKKGVENGIAYEIQKHIEKYGTKPHPFLLPALESNGVQIAAMLNSDLRKAVAEAGK